MNAYKPDKKFYDTLIKRAGVKPSEILFLDDRLENVKAARKCEIKSEQVKGHNVLEIIDKYMGDKMKEIIYNEDNLNVNDINNVVERAKAIIVNSKGEILLGYGITIIK